MSIQPVQVVVAYDFTPSAAQALARAAEAALRAPEHVLHIVTALDGSSGLGSLGHVTYDDADRVREQLAVAVTAAFAGRPAAAEVTFFLHTRIGKPAEEILSLAQEVGADLIYVGSHGKRGLERLLLGSVSERIVREARCAVIVARPKGYPHVELMKVVPYDHPHHAFKQPHRYTYTETRVITRPDSWPIS
jgi:nucleotide-binding universal stress UspA family protein